MPSRRRSGSSSPGWAFELERGRERVHARARGHARREAVRRGRDVRRGRSAGRARSPASGSAWSRRRPRRRSSSATAMRSCSARSRSSPRRSRRSRSRSATSPGRRSARWASRSAASRRARRRCRTSATRSSPSASAGWRGSSARRRSSASRMSALWHERDISHSSAERVAIPDAFLALDYMLDRFAWLAEGLVVRPERMRRNIEASFGSACEPAPAARSRRVRPRARRGLSARSARRDARMGRGASDSASSSTRTPRSPPASTSTRSSTRAPTPSTSTPSSSASRRSNHDSTGRPCMSEVVHVGSGKVRELYALDEERLLLDGERPHLDLRRRPADRDPGQGPRAHRPLGVLVRADARHRRETICLRSGPTAARSSAGGSRCCRSSASCAATSPAPAGRTTRRPAPSAGIGCPRGSTESERLPEPIFTPGDQGARAGTTRTSRASRRRSWSAPSASPRRSASRSRCTLRRRLRGAARDPARRHEVRTRAWTRTGCWFSVTRR